MYLLAIELDRPFRAVMADTGWEHPATLEYVSNLPRMTGGPVVEIIKADFTATFARRAEKARREGFIQRAEILERGPTGSAFVDSAMFHGRFPSRRARFCTEELKIEPMQNQVLFPALRNGPVLHWLGERAEESPSRARKPRFIRDDAGWWTWRPLLRWTLEDVINVHKRHCIRLNPLYYMGCSRVGCWPCCMAGKADLRAAFKADQDLRKRIEEAEALVGAASRRGGASFWPPGFALVGEDVIPTPAQVEAWSQTGRGGKQPELDLGEESGCPMARGGLCE